LLFEKSLSDIISIPNFLFFTLIIVSMDMGNTRVMLLKNIFNRLKEAKEKKLLRNIGNEFGLGKKNFS
jgi:hypothetical protein